MPIPSHSEDVLRVAWARISPRIPSVKKPPSTAHGSENLQKAWGNSSTPEYQWTTAICSLGGLKKCTSENRTDTKIAAGTSGKVWRTRPRIAPLKSASSMSATTIAVNRMGARRFHGIGFFNSNTRHPRKPTPKAPSVPAATRNPPATWRNRW